jgi:hypothetical protein
VLGPALARGAQPPGRPVVVCGAGAAGIAAALAAARCNVEVLLLEAAPDAGGTVANALIHTIGGLYDDAGEVINDGLPRELIERLQIADSRTAQRKMGRVWVLQVCPNVYRRVVGRWLGAAPRITTLFGTRVSALRQARGRISVLEVTSGKHRYLIEPRAVVDATGCAAVARLLDESHVANDAERAGGGLVFRLRNVAAGALQFPKGVGLVKALRAAAEAGALPSACRHAWIDVGIDPDEAFVKLLVPLTSNSARGEQSDFFNAVAMQQEVAAFLRQFPGFQQSVVAQTGSLGVRDGGRIAGRYTLSADDVRAGRRFADGVCRCAWPIEYWDAVQGVAIEYLAPRSSYEIPMRCLQLPSVDNFWAAGKCLSADRYAHASARVAGACWAMGQAAGTAAATFQPEEEAHEYQSLRPVSRNGAVATQPARRDCNEALAERLVSRAR